MRIAVMGAGGVGGYFGARLAEGGSEVAFVARGAHLAAMRERGLNVESELGNAHLSSPPATDDPAEVGPVDLVLFAVKLWDTEAAARAIAPLVGPDTAVVSFQNGVQKDDVLRAAVGEPPVIGGVCYISATIAEPGIIRHTGTLQRLVFGEYDGASSPRVEAFLQACRSAGIDAEISSDVRRAIWEKFVFLTGLAGVTAAARLPVGPVRSNPRTRALLHDAMREVVAVGRAEGIDLAADFADDRLAFCDTLPAEMTASMHRDLECGNALEVEWLSGDVVARGAAAGVPTPVNRVLAGLLAPYAAGASRS